MGAALQKALDQIGDAFRPERKERNTVILSGHRVMTLVQDGRYSFPEACRLLEIEPAQVVEAYKWLDKDNARMNAAYDTEIHAMTPGDLMMKAFFSHEEACLESDVVAFEGRAVSCR